MVCEIGVEVVVVDLSWVEVGMNWGSNQVVKVYVLWIVFVWDELILGYLVGVICYLFECKFGYRVILICVLILVCSDFSCYQVLIFFGFWGGYLCVL